MKDEDKTDNTLPQSMTGSLKGWMMAALILIFALSYVAALFGSIAPLKDNSVITRLEPIIFVIIDCCFGRLPAQADENALRGEIKRQSQKRRNKLKKTFDRRKEF